MTSTRSVATVLVAALALSAVAAGGAMADPTVDTSATDATTTVSDLQDGDTVSFEANASNSYTVQINGTEATDYGVEIALNDSDSDADGVVFATNESAENVSDAGGGMAHYNATISGDELADVPMQVGENVTVDVTSYETANESNSTTFQVTLDNEADRSVIYVGDTSVESGDLASVADESGWTIPALDYELPWGGDDSSTLTADGVAVNGSSTDVVFVLGNSSVNDDFDSRIGSLDSGAWQPEAASYVDGAAAPIFAANIPDSLPGALSGDSISSTTYESDVGGQPALVVDLGDEADGASSVDVEAASALGFFEQADAFGWLAAAGWTGGLSLGGLSLGLVGFVRLRSGPSAETDGDDDVATAEA